jgi:tetratricopeptide (TPR) repeat protein
VLAVVAFIAAEVLQPGHRGHRGLHALVPETTAPGSRLPAPGFSEFIGDTACADCHATQYAAWRGSTHGRAGAAPPGEAVIAPFDGRALRFQDAVVIPTRGPGGDYRFVVRQEDRPELVLVVSAVVGGGHMVGGGTQSFWAHAADGTWRFIPFDWSRTAQLWFCNTNGRLDRGWVPISTELPITACGDWPPRRVLGDHERLDDCQQCHGSQIELRFDNERLAYDTRFTTLAVNCESCHGPLRRHVERARRDSLDPELAVRSLATLDVDASLEVCFRCHALKEQIRPGYLPGGTLERHYSYALPVLAGRPHFPDGRVRLFAYQEQHRWSDCYLNGGMTCVSCHEPHGQGYRDANGMPLADRYDDGQCTACHPSKAGDVAAHTFHQPDSKGSRCVACHMPYLQEPNTGRTVPYARSDHTIPIPRPAFDAGLGIESACVQCHRDLPPARLEAQTRQWWGALKPHPRIVTGLLAADSEPTRLAEARRLLDEGARHPAAQIAALSHFLLHRLEPDMPALEPEIGERLERLAASPDRDVRALALASLHLARGEDPGVRRRLQRALRDEGRGTGDAAALTDRWAWMLTFRGDAWLSQRHPVRALAAYRKAWEVKPGDPVALRNLGAGYANTGDHARAIALFRESLARDDATAGTWAALGFELAQRNDSDGARAAYERAIALDPWDPTAWVSLGNMHARAGRAGDAARAWERALALDPSLSAAEFGLASAYLQMGRLDAARQAVRRGRQYDPDSPAARQITDMIERGGGRR